MFIAVQFHVQKYEKVLIYPKKKVFSFARFIFFPYLCTNYTCQEIQIQM